MGLFCGKRCQDRKDMKLLLSFENKYSKTDKNTVKAVAKQNTKSVAYQNGIDPHQAMWGGISSSVGSISDAAIAGLSPMGAFNKQTSMHYDASKIARSKADADIGVANANANAKSMQTWFSSPYLIVFALIVLYKQLTKRNRKKRK